MSSKKEIDDAIEQIGSATVHPIGKVEYRADGPRMSLVIGGIDQWAHGTVEHRTALFEQYLATGMYTRQEAMLMAGFETLPKEPPK